MKTLRKQGLLLHYDINPYNLKIIVLSVAVIKEDLLVLLCMHSPRVPALPSIGWEWRDRENSSFSQGHREIFQGLEGDPPPGSSSLGSLPCLLAEGTEEKRELLPKCLVAASEMEPAVGNVYHPAHNEAITLQSQL